MPEVKLISIFSDSIEIRSTRWFEAPMLSDFTKIFHGVLRDLTIRTIKGTASERVVAMDHYGLIINIDLPEDRIRRFTIFLTPNTKWVSGIFQGTVNVNGAKLKQGSKIKSLLSRTAFKFDNRTAIATGISLSYQPKYEFIENLTIGFRYPDPKNSLFVKERVSQLLSLN